MAKHKFQTEINQLLQLMIHSLYSNKDIFLRELISNSSDAIDKLQYLTLTDDALKGFAFEPKIQVDYDKEAKTLSISDTGIGMNDEDMMEHLGTIAKSGTKSFLEKLTGDAKKDSNLIGQFGVGFYASFMVADRVEVTSRKAGSDKAYTWTSAGDGEYEITDATRDVAGTTITLHVKEDAQEYISQWKLESIIKKYSDHVAFPIMLKKEKFEKDAKEPQFEIAQINKASALWRRSKSEITQEEYDEFYSSISHDSEKPLLHVHTKAEGTHEYTTLFYLPSKAPFDLYRVDYQPGVKLYVKRVFITDDDKELLPTYLRFARGIIDAEDLPLNVSREILQQNRLLATIKQASAKKILSEIGRLAKGEKEKFETFYEQFGRCLKEGLYQDHANKEQILELVRFKSSTRDGMISLEEYEAAMKSDQKAIYYVTGTDAQLMKNSPLLEGYKAKGFEVLICDEEIDEIVIPTIGKYKELDVKSVAEGLKDDAMVTKADPIVEGRLKPLMEKLTAALGDEVKEVRVGWSLTDSPSCVVFDEGEMNAQMMQILKAMGQSAPASKPSLEINPNHPIVAKLEVCDDVADVASILLDEAKLLGGMAIKDPASFAKKLNALLAKAL